MTTAHNDKHSSTNTAGHDTSSMDFLSQMVASGLSSTFESLKEKVTANIKDNGEQYLADSIEKLKTSATDLADWGKKNPLKTAAAVAAILAVTAFLVTTRKDDGTSSKSKKAGSEDEESGKSSTNHSSGRSSAGGSSTDGSSKGAKATAKGKR